MTVLDYIALYIQTRDITFTDPIIGNSEAIAVATGAREGIVADSPSLSLHTARRLCCYSRSRISAPLSRSSAVVAACSCTCSELFSASFEVCARTGWQLLCHAPDPRFEFVFENGAPTVANLNAAGGNPIWYLQSGPGPLPARCVGRDS